MLNPRFKAVAARAGWDEENLLMASLVVDNKLEQDIKKDEKMGESSSASCSSSSLPRLDNLREELSCGICLEILFEPTTTSCGHSFCKECLNSAADKCGATCPKCRQLIIMWNGRRYTVNTVLWNTIQLLFPQEVEARKLAYGALNSREEAERDVEVVRRKRRRVSSSQDEDDEDGPPPLAIRLQNRTGGGAAEQSREERVPNQDASHAVHLRSRLLILQRQLRAHLKREDPTLQN